jgi:predicted RNA polymerase sigma factor
MKAKHTITERPQKQAIPKEILLPNPLPMPSDQERKGHLAPWQEEIVALAEAYLSINGEEDVIAEMHRRAIGLCRMVEDLAISDGEVSMDALAKIMEVVQEEIQVARWLSSGKPRDWD